LGENTTKSARDGGTVSLQGRESQDTSSDGQNEPWDHGLKENAGGMTGFGRTTKGKEIFQLVDGDPSRALVEIFANFGTAGIRRKKMGTKHSRGQREVS